MSYDLGAFVGALMGDPALALIVVLTLGATVVNGATDAPNAIATVVGTKAMRPGPAIAMAAVCNFVGLAAITAVSSAVALTIFKMVDFGGDNHAALIALAAAMVAIIVWGVAAVLASHVAKAIRSSPASPRCPSSPAGRPGGRERRRVDEGHLRPGHLHVFGIRHRMAVSLQLIRLAGISSRADELVLQVGADHLRRAAWPCSRRTRTAQDFCRCMRYHDRAGGAVDSGNRIPFWLIILVPATMALGTAMGSRRSSSP